MNNILHFIGTIHSPLKNLEDCPRQGDEGAPEAVIEIFETYAEAAKDIKAGQQIMLLTWLHAADRSTLTTHPRNDVSLPLTGIFSTRSPARPNPIGLHTVTVLKVVSKTKFKVSGLEALDQTPLIDIKPVW